MQAISCYFFPSSFQPCLKVYDKKMYATESLECGSMLQRLSYHDAEAWMETVRLRAEFLCFAQDPAVC